ncbi:hypothetical protein [Weissella ceti]|uniref:hypothetical protein n=1 Tax=Weissella ceti TaxID=759620 RepID=UPI001BCF8114|nr:hypothetical protein [Weissella ceti]QVK11535.1 hypothetical protein KHQ31_04755 [Weissella ceti]
MTVIEREVEKQLQIEHLLLDKKSTKQETSQYELALREQLITNIQSELGYIDVFLELEYLSIYINYDVVLDEVVYVNMSHLVLLFMDESQGAFNKVKTSNQCFEGLTKLYTNWSKRKAKEKI